MKVIRYFLFILSIFYLSGCASYRAADLANLEFLLNATPKSKDLVAAAKAFSQEDCERYLGRKSLIQNFQPIQLVIHNNTEKSYDFSVSRLGLPYCRPEDVANTVHSSTGVSAIGTGAAGFVIGLPVALPVAAISALSDAPVSSVPIGILTFVPAGISAMVGGIHSSRVNEKLSRDYSYKAAKDQILEPHSSINALIFVPKAGYQSQFTVTLIDLETQKPVQLDVSTL